MGRKSWSVKLLNLLSKILVIEKVASADGARFGVWRGDFWPASRCNRRRTGARPDECLIQFRPDRPPLGECREGRMIRALHRRNLNPRA